MTNFSSPTGYPLGANRTWKIGSLFLLPLLNAIYSQDWKGGENIPKSGAMIAISNHICHLDPLVFTHFLFSQGRAVRFLAKDSLFRVPVLGAIVRAGEQIPVAREVPGASVEALIHAREALTAGHCVGFYPEGTFTRDPGLWPMEGKTGLARLAVITKVPVVPCAQWGAQAILEPYGRKFRIFPRKRVTVVAGKALDFSQWYGKADDHEAMIQATRYAMEAITDLLVGIRGESAPAVKFDPHSSDLPRTGNFKKKAK